MRKNYLLLTLMCLVFTGVFAQHSHNGFSCGTDHVNEQYFQNHPEAAARKVAFDAQLSQLAKLGKKFSATSEQELYEIPIVVHIIHDGEAIGVGSNKSDQQIIDWVNYTNAVYAGTAPGIVTENNGGTVIPVKLVLAKRTPDCMPTNGIVRVNASSIPQYSTYGLGSNSDFGASEETIRNLSRWNPEAYYNVYLVKTITGNIGNTPLEIGGYAYFPSSGNNIYGTFMRASTAQVGDVTFPHEVAHSLGIYHTFQGADSVGDACPPNETDCYVDGDNICDTEPIKSMASSYPIPSNNMTNPCTGMAYANTQYNIMSYGSVNDRFTPQQSVRAVAQLLFFRSGLLNSLGATPIDDSTALAELMPMCTPTEITNPQNYQMGPVNVTMGTLNISSPSGLTTEPYYVNYAASCLFNSTATIAGYEATDLSISITGQNSQKIRAYVDWNNDGVFDAATETIYSQNAVNGGGWGSNNVFTASVTPPIYAVKDVPLRLRVIADSNSMTITPCQNPLYGQVEDYAVIVEETNLGCAGISNEITAAISVASGIVDTQYNLSATGVIGTDGIGFQWQSSSTGVDSWTAISDATSNLHTLTAAGANGDVTFYRLKVTCMETQVDTFSDVVSFEIFPEYCAAGVVSFASEQKISNVTFADINNNSISTSGYEDFSAITANVQAGESYSFSVSSTGATYNDNQILVYIDNNYDGDFDDEGEMVFQTTSVSPWNGSITIPSNSSLGKKRMRIRLHYNDVSGSFVPNATPCGVSTFGQVEDYSINIMDEGCAGISDTITATITNTTGAPNSEMTLSATGVQGVNGVSYQWQKSTNGTSGWQDVPNATTKSTTQTASNEPGTLTYYQLKVTCTETQVSTFSNVISFETALNYCSAGSISLLYEKIGNVAFADINNSSIETFSYEDFSSITGNVVAGESYTFTATDIYGSYPTDQVLVWIDFNNNGSFADAGELVFQQVSTSPWTGVITIPGNVSVGNKRMRIRLHDTSSGPNAAPCGTATYGQVEDYTLAITRVETIWDGAAWSNGVPNETKKAVVIGALTMDTDLVASELVVSETGAITIASGTNFTVNGPIVNEGDAIDFVVEHGGNLIQQSDAANTGAITVKRNSNMMVRNDNTMWASPVTGQSVRSFSAETLYNRFWTYNEATNLFSSIFSTATDDTVFTTGLGYSIRVRNTLAQGQSTIHEGIFTGTPFNGSLNVPVVNTGTALQDKGYNSIGNPYPSSIAVVGPDGFLAANPGVEALYFWTHEYPVLPQGGYAGSNYASYTALNSDELGAISTGQGFIVKTATTGNVVFNNAMRTTLVPVVFSSTTDKHRLWLKLSNATQMLSKTLIGYMEGATNEFDTQIDGKLIDHTSTTLYNVMNNEKYAIQGRALPFETSDVVALGFKVTEMGQYTIAIESMDGLFAEGQAVYLKDNLSNTIHNLNNEPFVFDAVAGEYNNRFEVLYENETLDNSEFSAENVLVYHNQQNVIIKSPKENIATITLYDSLGRVLYQNNAVNDTSFKVSAASFGNQILIVQVKTASGMVITKKLINN